MMMGVLGTCTNTYVLSFICDELDGRCARRFNQCTEFGAVLDMVTDRLAYDWTVDHPVKHVSSSSSSILLIFLVPLSD